MFVHMTDKTVSYSMCVHPLHIMSSNIVYGLHTICQNKAFLRLKNNFVTSFQYRLHQYQEYS